MRLLLVGATGLVGGHVLRLALADARITQVTAPVRRALPQAAGLLAPQVDYAALPPDAPWWQADAVICTLGTTIRTAGSQAAFRRVDHDYPLAVARLARAAGTPVYVLNSAIGADAGSRFFYNRVKGELERDLQAEGFASLTFVRPGLIGGRREEFRAGERIMQGLLGALGPVLPARWRLNPAPRIAAALLEAAVQARPGVHVITADTLT
ncbi:NAD-dependent dehydratase [Bordetella genomosp. 1]|uniref:NAD-dependent dehydratase n=1 Tax=Bordetella genomosp. 1 TaxID=1395607 RepID=A0ABX4EY33_9BORD|nr:NAD-dependent dehydratase [Bordetella genomosp. 1]OZI63983.1 NAD-dependent dehydratase [Bordetella genomosp. 1]